MDEKPGCGISAHVCFEEHGASGNSRSAGIRSLRWPVSVRDE